MCIFLYKTARKRGKGIHFRRLNPFLYHPTATNTMFKLAVLLVAAMCIATSQGLFAGGVVGGVGGFVDRPELIDDQTVQALTSFAAENLAITQNLILSKLKVISVQTQVVAGVNYQIDFKAEPVNGVSGQTTTCRVVIYVRFDSTKNILSSQCQTA